MLKVLVSLILIGTFSSHYIRCNRLVSNKEYLPPIELNLEDLNLSQDDFYNIIMSMSHDSEKVGQLSSSLQEPQNSLHVRSTQKRYKPLIYNGFTLDMNIDLFRSLVTL